MLALVIAVALQQASGDPPRLPSVTVFADRYGQAVATVHPLEVEARVGGEAEGVTCFFVATSGIAVSALPAVKAGDKLVVELPSGNRRPAQVVAKADDSPLALISVDGGARELGFPTLALADAPFLQEGWLVGVFLHEGKRTAALGGLRSVAEGRWQLDVPVGPGTPVVDADGKVVAVAIARKGKQASVGVPVEQVMRLVRTWSAAREP